MTDNEIIKALECCVKTEFISDCAKCEMFAFDCKDILIENALDLINRQKAKNESLKVDLAKCSIRLDNLYKTADEIKSEAIKEFAERLKGRLTGICRSTIYGNFEYGTIKSYEIDNLVKEIDEKNSKEE